jgi:hypothetical protein
MMLKLGLFEAQCEPVDIDTGLDLISMELKLFWSSLCEDRMFFRDTAVLCQIQLQLACQ